MADVALTDIRYGAKGRFNADGSVSEEEAAKTIKAGDEVDKANFSDEEYKQLEDSGVLGSSEDLEKLAVNLGSTASILQREDSVSLTNVPPEAGESAGPPSEEDVAEALDEATNQVDRDENPAVEAVAATTSSTTSKKSTASK